MPRALVSQAALVPLLLASLCALAEQPATDVAELKVLDQYLGEWDVEIMSSRSGLKRGKLTARWILEGRFLERTAELLSEDGSSRVELRTLFTYDSDAAKYRSWTFVSNGSVSTAEATWDAEARTMTWVTQPSESGVRATTVTDFSQPGVERWTITLENANGMKIGELNGVSTRKTAPVGE